jgi:hypothetical protein
MAKKIRRWMADQVITTSMDDKSASIARLLKWVKESTDESIERGAHNDGQDDGGGGGGGGDSHHGHVPHKISVCFCGPPAMGDMLDECVSQLGADLEFNAHTQ